MIGGDQQTPHDPSALLSIVRSERGGDGLQ